MRSFSVQEQFLHVSQCTDKEISMQKFLIVVLKLSGLQKSSLHTFLITRQTDKFAHRKTPAFSSNFSFVDLKFYLTKLPWFHTKTVSFIAKSLQPLISSVKKIPSRQGSDIYPNLEQCKRLFFCPLFNILLLKMKPFVLRIFFLWFWLFFFFRSLWQRNLNLGIFIWSIVCFHYPFFIILPFLSPQFPPKSSDDELFSLI